MNKINAEQLVNGALNYLNTEIIPCIDDTFTKLAIKTFILTTENKIGAYKNLINNFIQDPFIHDFLQVDDKGMFEIETVIDSLRKAVNECGELTVRIPPVRFISPEEKILNFNSTDISKLKQYLTTETK